MTTLGSLYKARLMQLYSDCRRTKNGTQSKQTNPGKLKAGSMQRKMQNDRNHEYGVKRWFLFYYLSKNRKMKLPLSVRRPAVPRICDARI